VAPLTPSRRWYGGLDDLDELGGGFDGAVGSRGYDECCDSRGPPFLTEVTDDPGGVCFGLSCDDLCCG